FIFNRWTRFHWNQEATQELSVSHNWGIKDIYIGPACKYNCFGHGSCYKFQCKCDKGYSGEYCRNVTANIKYFKDTFNYPKIDTTYWSQIFGGKIDYPCQSLIEGMSITFSGWGLRILETTDMDLRDAKFIQYIAHLGGSGDGIACIDALYRNQSILLQFSIDGGMKKLFNLVN
ncbi:reelin-like, partial [Centruroides sculpturatus]|uniref:reelin-like n=1 Tax=Centruroides sculpturatus TaxID=218467 RepID=UPI000C6D9634